jgi:PCFT/HCP family folate transporter-like MFS transporter 1/3
MANEFKIKLNYFRKFGFYGVFGTSLAILSLNLVYTLFYIKDRHIKKVETKKNFIVDFFDTENVSNTFRVAFKKTQDNRRHKLIAILTVAMLLIGPLHGEIAVSYLFTRFKFNWSEVEYSIFSTYSMALQMIGIIIAVSYFSKKLKVRDSVRITC